LTSFFSAIDEAKIASLEKVASQDEATILTLPLKASLVLLCRAPPLSEAKIVLLLALSGALSLTSTLRSLALGALPLAS